MSRHARLGLTMLIAAVTLLAAVATSATAGKLSIRLTQLLRAVWEQLEFGDTSFGFAVRCPVTLEGSLHSWTIAKVQRSLIGYISRAAVNNTACTGGRVTILQETLPWHLRYTGFSGTLPLIETLVFEYVGATFLIEAASTRCKATTTATNPGRVILGIREALKIISIRADETALIPLTEPSGGAGCSITRGRLRGDGSIKQLATGVELSIKLI